MMFVPSAPGSWGMWFDLQEKMRMAEQFVTMVIKNIQDATERTLLVFTHKCRLILEFPKGAKISFNWPFPAAAFVEEAPEIWAALQGAGFTQKEAGK